MTGYGGQILMGYKGQSLMDCGYFYAPYHPLTQTPTVDDPNYPIVQYPSNAPIYGQAVPQPPQPKYRSIDDEWWSDD